MRRPYKIAAIIIALATAVGFYRYRWGVLGVVGIGPPQSACKSVKALETYLNTGGDPSAYLWRTPLIMCAAEAGNETVVAELIEAGADVNAQLAPPRILPIYASDTDTTALYVAVRDDHQGMVKLLVDNGADINLAARLISNSPLNLAVSLGRPKSLRVFLNSDIDNYEFDSGSLSSAARQGHLEIFEILIGQGFELESGYKNALGSATRSNQLNVVKFLIANDVEISDSLHLAIQSKSLEMLEFLISTGSDVNAINREGDAPLHLTATRGLAEAAKTLADNGADINLENAEGQTPLDLAVSQGNQEIEEFLRSQGGVMSE
ncbi:MAG: ankyrin repeat domain-containing protein [Leptolyngbya sp. SIOISBB]|nr:ankyrin repeat domain-containing protein [Leptolyngbya sp. SIOISBB]